MINFLFSFLTYIASQRLLGILSHVEDAQILGHSCYYFQQWEANYYTYQILLIYQIIQKILGEKPISLLLKVLEFCSKSHWKEPCSFTAKP